MLYRTTLPATLAAALAFGVLPALAATTSPANTPDLAGFQHARITLDQAIASAQKAGGGTATDAEFMMMHGKGGYAINVRSGTTMKELWVDGMTGEARPVNRVSTAELNRESVDKADLLGVRNAKTTLEQAVALAQQHSGGKAIDASVGMRNDKVAYNVQVLRAGKLSTVWVDLLSGQIGA